MNRPTFTINHILKTAEDPEIRAVFFHYFRLPKAEAIAKLNKDIRDLLERGIKENNPEVAEQAAGACQDILNAIGKCTDEELDYIRAWINKNYKE